MSYPSEFYYRQTKSAVHYWEIPIGDPDFNRLIQGKSSYWRNPSASRDKKPKKLVLADWTAYNWSWDKIDTVKNAIARMIDEGFIFYVWQDGQLEPLGKDELDRLERDDVRRSITPAYNKEIIDAAIKHNITSSEIHVLDDYWLQHILKKDDQPSLPRHLKLDDMEMLYPNLREWRDKILDIELHSKPPLELYINNKSGFDSHPFEVVLIDELPRVSVENRITKMLISEQHFITQLTSGVRSAVNTQDKVSFKFSQLQHIENIQFQRIGLSYIETLIKETPALTSLSLIDIYLDKEFDFNIELLRKIKSFQFRSRDSKIPLDLYLSNMPGINHLEISTVAENFIIPPNSLIYLTDFKIHRPTKQECIYAICAAAPNLKKIKISSIGSGYNSQPIIFNLGNFNSLEEIEITDTLQVPDKTLRSLLESTPKLKKLIIKGPFVSRLENLLLPPDSLVNLEEIDLSHASITVDCLINLIAASPKLKKLNLSNTKIIEAKTPLKKAFMFQPGSLALLNEINFSNHEIILPKLSKILKNDYDSDSEEESTSSTPIDPTDARAFIIRAFQTAAPNLKKCITEEKPTNPRYLPQKKEKAVKPYSYYLSKSNASVMGSQANAQSGIHGSQVLKSHRDGVDKLSTSLNTQSRNTITNVVAKLDADTSYAPDKEINLTRIFYSTGHNPHPQVSHYRLGIYDAIQINPDVCSERDAFTLLHRSHSQLVTCNPIKSDIDVHQLAQSMDNIPNHQYIYGKQALSLTRNWQPIASLSAEEEMTHFHVDPLHAVIEIQRSEHDNLYYIRSLTGNQKIHLDFILNVPEKKIPLPTEILELVDKFNHFGEGKLDIDSSRATGQDYLNAIIEQEKGACRHRAVAFKAEMQRLYPDVPTRIITNDCHAFAEIQINDQWVTCQLGGYEAKLTIQETNHPEKKAGEASSVTQVMLPNNGEAVEIGNTKYYHSQLETWESTKRLTDTYKKYCQQCLLPGKVKKRLIKLDSTTNVDAMRFALQDYCLNESKRPFFYINSPDNFVCSAPFVKRHSDDTGELKKGPGGLLYDFLVATRESDSPPILLINYDNFEAEDIVRINNLLDKERRADGTPLPVDAIVIGLINVNKPDCYQGSDFYSRFDEKETCPLSDEELAKAVPLIPIAPESGKTEDTPVINLYHALDWKERLLGRWEIEKGILRFKKGALVTAFEQQVTTIEIKNGLMDDPEFQRFWREARLCGYIESAGQRIPIPDDFQFISSEGYDWSTLKQSIVGIEWDLSPNGVVLNPTRLGTFFNRYDCNNDTLALITIDGVIPSFANQILTLNVTRTLSDDDWAMILDACQSPHHPHVKLHLHCAPGVKLPEALMASKEPSPAPLVSWDESVAQATQIIVSTDIDTTLATLTQVESPNDIIIDVSECSPSDLLTRINGKLNDADPPRLEFKKNIGIVRRTLMPDEKPEKRIILKGRFSLELADELQHYLFEREQASSNPGQLIIISEQKELFSGQPMSAHTVTIEDKKALLGPNELSDQIIEKESLNQLKARCHYLNANPGRSSNDAWIGMRHLSPQMHETGEFDAANSAAKSELFNQMRLDSVKKALGLPPFEQASKHAPFIFLTGLSGVGKSTFVKKELRQHVASMHFGENKIAAWATDPTPGTKILFIDEANLSQNEWSQFEGLFNTPPGIYVREGDEDHYYPLTSDHKVIFAGNPCSYGDERQLAPFFERYGKAILFTPLPPESIYELTLKPVFEKTGLSQKTCQDISYHLLDVYRFLCAESEHDVLVSPRELQMMALLINQHHQQFSHLPHYDVMLITKKIAWDLAKHLVPTDSRARFDQLFHPTMSVDIYPDLIASASSSDFRITESRAPIAQQLDDLLALRLWRQEQAQNDAQKYGGLGGIVLEGEPGVGKSELIIDRLIANGFQEMHDFRAPSNSKHVFYRMPVSMPIAEKEELLLKAFKEGSVVVIDEINCSPMMERFLNDLLMGEIPTSTTSNESNGQSPPISIDKSMIKPGFMIMGTQNPITMAGRRATSTALQRRLLTQEMPIYSRHEMADILIAKGLPDDEVESLIRAYEKSVAHAQTKNLLPVPNFRDLSRLADDIVLGHKRAPAKTKIVDTTHVVVQKPSAPKLASLPLEPHISHQKSAMLKAPNKVQSAQVISFEIETHRSDISPVFTNFYELLHALQKFNFAECQAFLNANKDALLTMIDSGRYSISAAVRNLNTDQIKAFLITIKDIHPPQSVKNFISVIHRANAEKSKMICDILLNDVVKTSTSIDDLMDICENANSAVHPMIYTAFLDRLPEIVQTRAHFITALYYADYEQAKIVCDKLKHQYPQLIPTLADIVFCLSYLKPASCKAICESLEEQAAKWVRAISDLAYIFQQLEPIKCQIICQVIKDHLPRLIPNAEKFVHFIESIDQDKRKVLYEAVTGTPLATHETIDENFLQRLKQARIDIAEDTGFWSFKDLLVTTKSSEKQALLSFPIMKLELSLVKANPSEIKTNFDYLVKALRTPRRTLFSSADKDTSKYIKFIDELSTMKNKELLMNLCNALELGLNTDELNIPAEVKNALNRYVTTMSTDIMPMITNSTSNRK